MVSTSLHAVATSGDYNDLLNIPNLHTVATSGEYSDLVNTPTIAVEIQEAGTQTLTEAKTLNFGSDFSLTASGSTVDISLDISGSDDPKNVRQLLLAIRQGTQENVENYEHPGESE